MVIGYKAPLQETGCVYLLKPLLMEVRDEGMSLTLDLSPCQLRNDYMQRYASKVSEGMALQLGCLELRYVTSSPSWKGAILASGLQGLSSGPGWYIRMGMWKRQEGNLDPGTSGRKSIDWRIMGVTWRCKLGPMVKSTTIRMVF